jgi:hypothetical protein
MLCHAVVNGRMTYWPPPPATWCWLSIASLQSMWPLSCDSACRKVRGLVTHIRCHFLGDWYVLFVTIYANIEQVDLVVTVLVCIWEYWFESRTEHLHSCPRIFVFFLRFASEYWIVIKVWQYCIFSNFFMITSLIIFLIHSMQSNLTSSDSVVNIQSRLHRHFPRPQSWLLLNLYTCTCIWPTTGFRIQGLFRITGFLDFVYRPVF